MPDLHTRAVSSTDQLDLRLAIRDAIDGSIAKILQIQNDEGPFTAERFEQVERQTLEVCMELGRRVLQEVLEDRDAQLPDAIEQDGRVLRRRKATPKTIATLLGNAACRRSRYRTRIRSAADCRYRSKIPQKCRSRIPQFVCFLGAGQFSRRGSPFSAALVFSAGAAA